MYTRGAVVRGGELRTARTTRERTHTHAFAHIGIQKEHQKGGRQVPAGSGGGSYVQLVVHCVAAALVPTWKTCGRVTIASSLSRQPRGGDRMSKRPADASAMYCAEPDLRVIVTDEAAATEETIEVHSQVLMLGSPIWKSMLTGGMLEAAKGEVKLIDKDPDEFKLSTACSKLRQQRL